MSRILRLALLAPDVIEAILAGKTDKSMILDQVERPLPAMWEQQRELLTAQAVRKVLPDCIVPARYCHITVRAGLVTCSSQY